jgi:hypothetical protein
MLPTLGRGGARRRAARQAANGPTAAADDPDDSDPAEVRINGHVVRKLCSICLTPVANGAEHCSDSCARIAARMYPERGAEALTVPKQVKEKRRRCGGGWKGWHCLA